MYFLSNFAILTKGVEKYTLNEKGVVNMGDKVQYNMGATIRAYRKNNRYTQIELAKKIGVSQAMISQIEKGIMPSEEIQNKIAKFLNIPVTRFKKKLSYDRNGKKYTELVPEDFVNLYNSRQPILVKMLHREDYEYGEIFPAIIGVKRVGELQEQEDICFEFVIIYNYNRTLSLLDYKKTWVAYRFDNNILNERYGIENME